MTKFDGRKGVTDELAKAELGPAEVNLSNNTEGRLDLVHEGSRIDVYQGDGTDPTQWEVVAAWTRPVSET